MKYVAPTSVEEAHRLLVAGDGAHVFAGATDLIPQIRAGRPEPGLAIDLKRISRLVEMRLEDGTWTVGAAVPAARVTADPGFTSDFPGLSEAAGLIGSDQIQSRASLGGNLANASPAADTVPAMVVNGAEAVIVTSDGTRTDPVSGIVTGPGTTSLGPGEFLAEILVEQPPPNTADAYLRFIPRAEMDIAVVGAAARVTLDGSGAVASARFALGAVAPTVVRVERAEEAVVGRTIDDALLDEVATAASAAGDPIDDKRGTKEFRRRIAGVLTKRAFALAMQRAGGDR